MSAKPSQTKARVVKAPLTPTLETYWKTRYPTYQYAAHVALLIGTLEQLRPGDALIINMAPRHGKSESVKAYIEWHMASTRSTASFTARTQQGSLTDSLEPCVPRF